MAALGGALRGRVRTWLLLTCVVALLGARAVRALPLRCDRPLGAQIEAAAAGTELVAPSRCGFWTVSRTIVIARPLTLRGVRVRLRADVGRTPILRVLAPNVVLQDFVLVGNGAVVSQDDRAPLVQIRRGGFLVERGVFRQSSKNGVEIVPQPGGPPIDGGVVRHVRGWRVIRDVVSIASIPRLGLVVRNVLVQHVRAYESRLRGAVEVSDGSQDITVADVFASRCVYAVDLQDHGDPAQVNRRISIDRVTARNCSYAVRSSTSDFPHADVSVRNVRAFACGQALQLRNVRRVRIRNVRVVAHRARSPAALAVDNCAHVEVHNVRLLDGMYGEAGLELVNTRNLTVDGLQATRQAARQMNNALRYRITRSELFAGVRISGVVAPDARYVGILLLNQSPAGAIRDVVLARNQCTVRQVL